MKNIVIYDTDFNAVEILCNTFSPSEILVPEFYKAINVLSEYLWKQGKKINKISIVPFEDNKT